MPRLTTSRQQQIRLVPLISLRRLERLLFLAMAFSAVDLTLHIRSLLLR